MIQRLKPWSSGVQLSVLFQLSEVNALSLECLQNNSTARLVWKSGVFTCSCFSKVLIILGLSRALHVLTHGHITNLAIAPILVTATNHATEPFHKIVFRNDGK